MASDNREDIKYVYQLPYFQRIELCQLLDRMDKWEELGGKYMKFDVMRIQDLRTEILRRSSPSDKLLTLWGYQNHTILELFVLLSEMQHYQAMVILKPFVPPEYHRLIYEGEEVYLKGNLVLNAGSKVPSTEVKGHSTAGNEPRVVMNGQTSRTNVPTVDHNLNITDSTNSTRNKLDFLLEQPGERNCFNNMRPSAPVLHLEHGNETRNPRARLHTRTSQDTSSRFPPENKENNVLTYNQQRKMSNASDASSVTENCGAIPLIDYKELLEATQGWAAHNILGKGGFGTVFKGNWKNTQVAVKRIEQRGAAAPENNRAQLVQSLTELRVLNSCRHDNILPIFGFSSGGDEPCLVYQFMPNGSLEDRILCRKGTPPLTWLQRHDIAQGTARGLQFLHNNSKPFIHGDIKSANILLDINFIPRIGDFGLARDGPQNDYTHIDVSRVHGTRPYLPDEFLRGKKLSVGVDTYSFGIVLFELATGLRPYDDSRSNKLLKEHIKDNFFKKEPLEKLMDKKAVPEDPVTFQHLLLLGIKCIEKIPRQRPKMEVVLEALVEFAARHKLHDRVQYPGNLGNASTGGQYGKTNLTLTIPSPHPIGNVQQTRPNNFYFRPLPNVSNSHNLAPIAGFPSLSPSPVEQQPSSLSPLQHMFQPISAMGMHSPLTAGVGSHPSFPVIPQYVPSPEIEVSPPSRENHGVNDNYLPAVVAELCSRSQNSSRESNVDQELTPPAQSNSERAQSPTQNDVDVSVLYPNLSILGIGEESHSTRNDASSAPSYDRSSESHFTRNDAPSVPSYDSNSESSINNSSYMSHSSARDKPLLFSP